MLVDFLQIVELFAARTITYPKPVLSLVFPLALVGKSCN